MKVYRYIYSIYIYIYGTNGIYKQMLFLCTHYFGINKYYLKML